VKVPAFGYRVALYLMVGLLAVGFAYAFGPYGPCPMSALTNCASHTVVTAWDFGPFVLMALTALIGEVLARRSRRHAPLE
jgi:hypothetical protein